MAGSGFLGYGVTCGAVATFSRILAGVWATVNCRVHSWCQRESTHLVGEPVKSSPLRPNAATTSIRKQALAGSP
jgi:hypothetical protein